MYIWNKEIKSIKGEIVTFNDKTTIELSEDYIKYLSSKEPSDNMSMNKILKMQSDILKIFVNASATKQEITSCIQWVTNDLIRHEKNVMCDILWTKDYLDINFRELNKRAIKIQDNDFTN